jgi:SAM-dependent methyltransferase
VAPARINPDETPSFYRDAAIYDILHGHGTAGDVDLVERVADRYAPGAPGLWLEPACGSGRCLRLAAARGRSVIGFDLEPGMIAYARRRAERLGLADRSTYFVGDMRDFALGRVPALLRAGSVGVAFNLINTIRHLPDDASMLAHLQQVARVLHRRGVYLVGLSLTAYGLEFPSEDVWSGARGRCRVTQVVNYEPATARQRVERVHSVLTVDRPSGSEHRVSGFGLRAYSPAQWLGLLARSALEVAAEIDETGASFESAPPGYSLWVLRRRATRSGPRGSAGR